MNRHILKPQDASALLVAVYIVYFSCGMAMCFEGLFLPEFKSHFDLSYQKQMYMMFSKNIPFVIFPLFSGLLTRIIGFKRMLGLSTFLFGIGTCLLIPGIKETNYNLLLLAFFIIGSGFNLNLMAGNPLLILLGRERGSSGRLNLGNALGAIAQIIAPITVIFIIPSQVRNIDEKLPYIINIFIAIALFLFVISFMLAFLKSTESEFVNVKEPNGINLDEKSAWKDSQIQLGFIAIFLSLGVEAGFFGFYRNFLEDPSVAGLTSSQSQKMFTVYFALFAMGRVAAWLIQKYIRPAVNLFLNVIAGLILTAVIFFAKGWLVVWSITLIGFFISIFFPTIYSISIRGLRSNTGQASGILSMGMLGAAIIPVLQGLIADKIGLQNSFFIAFFPYSFLLFFALKYIRKESFQ